MARIVPALQRAGIRVHVVRGETHPYGEIVKQIKAEGTLATALGKEPTAVVIDQTEEIFTSGTAKDQSSFRTSIAAVLAASSDQLRFVLGVREDFLGVLLRTLQPLPLDELARTVRSSGWKPTTSEGARRAGRPEVAVRPSVPVQPAVLDVIVRDLLADSAGESRRACKQWGFASGRS
jgi:hypothetical protein